MSKYFFWIFMLDKPINYGRLKTTREKTMLGKYQKIYKFGNNYGASVVCSNFSYGGDKGLFEVAVLDLAGDIVTIRQ
jgi:hypothetical protein